MLTVPGTKIWYEPSPGVRFSGVVLGPGSLDGTMRVEMHAAYWRWRGVDRTVAYAISAEHCYPDAGLPAADGDDHALHGS